MEIKETIKTELQIKNIQCSDEIVDLYINKVKSYIQRYCNIKEIPSELNYLIVDMTVSMIENKYTVSSGEKEVKSKSMGDTSISYNTVSRKEYTYKEITNQFSNELNNFRCLRW